MTKSLLARPANAPSPSWQLQPSLTGLNLLVDGTCTRHSAVPGYSQPRLSALNFGLRENSGETWRCRVSTAMVLDQGRKLRAAGGETWQCHVSTAMVLDLGGKLRAAGGETWRCRVSTAMVLDQGRKLRAAGGETWQCHVSTAMVFAISTVAFFDRTTRVGRIRP